MPDALPLYRPEQVLARAGVELGRKNWLFGDTERSAKAGAALYGLIETAKANRLNPYAYLQRVF